MKTYKTTQKQIDNIRKGLKKYIDYAEEYYLNTINKCKKYYDNMQLLKDIKGEEQINNFFNDLGISKEDFFEAKKEYFNLKVACECINNVDNIHNNVICIFIEPEGNEYPLKVKEWLNTFKCFCLDDNFKILPLENQNLKLSKYPHFDASCKCPKCFNKQ